MIEYMEKFIKELLDYLGRPKQIYLWLLPETIREELYKDIKDFFNKKNSQLELRLVHEMKMVIHRDDRFSRYCFKNLSSVNIFESEKLPIFSVRYHEEDGPRNTAYFLLHQLKESLGVKLSIKNH